MTAMVGMLQAPPGTRLYERLKKEGRLLGQMSGNTDGTTNILTRMDFKTLREGYDHVLNYLCSPRQYYRRIRIFFQEYNPPRVEVHMDLQRFLAFFRSGLRLGVLGKERFQYWRILWWTLLHRPQLFTLAITLAIYGYHFRRVSRFLAS